MSDVRDASEPDDVEPGDVESGGVEPRDVESIDAGARPVGRPIWTWFRERLDAVGFRPSRRLGQNFLLDDNLIRAIVRDAQLEPHATVVEIGVGCGLLTRELVHAGASVIAIEIDARLLPIARELVGQMSASAPVQWIEGDVLAGKHAWNPAVLAALSRGPWHLVSNLPYAVSAPVLALAAFHEPGPRSATVLVQREVADRLCAEPGTPEWGPLSIAVQLAFAPQLVRNVPPSAFWPRPQIDSAVVRLVPRPDRDGGEECRRVADLAGRVLQHRRQGIARALASVLGSRDASRVVLEALAIEPLERAENLDLAAWRRMRATIRARSDAGGDARLGEGPDVG